MPFVLPRRWPSRMLPYSCEFGRSRNDELQKSPRSQIETVLRRGRPLWTAKVTFQRIMMKDDGQFRLIVDGLDGFAKAIQIWDFSAPTGRGTGRAFGAAVNADPPANLYWEQGGLYYPWEDQGNAISWNDSINAFATGGELQGGYQVAVYGLQPNENILFAGDYVQIGRRLYYASDVCRSDGAGFGIIQVTTPLLSNVAAQEEIFVRNAACEMRLANQSYTGARAAGEPWISWTLEFVETGRDYPLNV